MGKLSKRVKAAKLMQTNETLFKCPICSSTVKVINNSSLVCSNNHTFDFARQGYLHLLSSETNTKYDQDLFIAREKVVRQNDFFKPLIEQITDQITKYTTNKQHISVADMGCGEGSILYSITENIEKDMTTIGIDIAKAGILEAAKNYEDILWLVADLTYPPLKRKTIDVILNILSPSNYKSFNELLVNDGIVIKVIPRNGYLQELRKYFNMMKRENDEKVATHFTNHFTVVDHKVVHYEKKLDIDTLQALMKMTPLTWGIEKKKLTQFLQIENNTITVELDMFIGIIK